MRWTTFLALVAALVIAPTAHAAGDPIKILRDCNDDSVLQGDYSPAELRAAQKELPTDLDEYSDCRDLLSRALSDTTSSSNDKSGGDSTDDSGGAAGGTSGGDTSGGTDTSGGSPESAPTPVATPTTPVSQQDWEAVTAAGQRGDDPMEINGRAVSPGATRLAADVGRNGLPGTLIAVLALIGAAAVASVAPFIRRRVLSHRQA